MGAIGGLIGLSGGAAGSGFAAPQQAQLTAPTNTGQIGTAYTGTQGAMTGQQALLQALQAQNGLGNQAQVYGQLQGIASGTVNPAQAQFAKNTAQNVGNQAALMAGQRGASQNVGLIARQAAQQGAGIQQQAVGQEAAQQAQNQIAAIGQAGQLATTQAGQQIGQTNANVSAQQAEQQNLLQALQGYNTNQVQSQASVNAGNAALAQTTMQGQQNLIGGALNGAASFLGGGSGGGAAQGGEIIKLANGGWTQQGPAVIAQGPTSDPSRQPLQFAPGDPSNTELASGQQPEDPNAPKNSFTRFINNSAKNKNVSDQPFQMSQQNGKPAQLQTGMSNLISALGGKGKKQTSVSTGSPDVDSSVGTYGTGAAGGADTVQQQPVGGMIQGGFSGSAQSPYAQGGMTKDFRAGGKVNASSLKEKAVKGGNDYSNDKIPAVLSEHEIVLPRSVTLSKDPVGESAKFVAKVIAQRKGKK
jgi:hypothetical protein